MWSNIKNSKMLDIQLSLNTNILERVCSHRYLGLILDEQLTYSYNKHIKEMTKLISHKLYLVEVKHLIIYYPSCMY